MKTLNIKQLDEKDEEIADTLISLGMSRNAALTLAYMQNMNSATSQTLNAQPDYASPKSALP